MAHLEELGGSKNISIELNLVPFIDLMSVCIIFLLITAVWTQVSMIQLGSSLNTTQTATSLVKKKSVHSDIPFRVNIIKDGFSIIIGSERMFIPLNKKKYNAQDLLNKIKQIKTVYPTKQNATVSAHNTVRYKHIIVTMDMLLKAGFSNVTIATGEM